MINRIRKVARLSLLLGVAALVAGCTAPGTNPNGATSMNHAAHVAKTDGTSLPPGVTNPGQDAFGAMQEVVAALDADPSTDWSKVNISALRDHLIDMNEVALNSAVQTRAIPGGFEAAISGQSRTVGAIQRMVSEHAAMGLREKPQWHASVQRAPDGATLAVTTDDASEAQHIRALGFFGVMVTGAHHQEHHLMLARGEMMH